MCVCVCVCVCYCMYVCLCACVYIICICMYGNIIIIVVYPIKCLPVLRSERQRSGYFIIVNKVATHLRMTEKSGETNFDGKVREIHR